MKTFRVKKMPTHSERFVEWSLMDHCDPHCGCEQCCNCSDCVLDRKRYPDNYKGYPPTYAQWVAMKPVKEATAE